MIFNSSPIKKLLLISFVISLAYALYRIPSYWHPTTIDGEYVGKIFAPSDFVFNLIGWFLPIFIVLLLGQSVIKWSWELDMPFEKALSLVNKVFLFVIGWSILTVLILIPLAIFGIRLWRGTATTENISLGLISTIAPFAIPVFLILILLDITTLKLLKGRSRVGWYLAFLTGLTIYIIPPGVFPLVIWWFLLKYRKEYFQPQQITQTGQMNLPPKSKI